MIQGFDNVAVDFPEPEGPNPAAAFLNDSSVTATGNLKMDLLHNFFPPEQQKRERGDPELAN